MSSEGSNRETGQNFGARYARGLRTSARNNGPAYGYSATITATLAILSAVEGAPGVLEVFIFAGGAIAAAFVTALLVGPGAAWPLGAFLSTLVYLVLVGFEIALAEKMRLDNGEDEAS